MNQTFSFWTTLVQQTQQCIVSCQCLVRCGQPHLRETLKATELWDGGWGRDIRAGSPSWWDETAALEVSAGRGWEWDVHLHKLVGGKSHWWLCLTGLGFLGGRYIRLKICAAVLITWVTQAKHLKNGVRMIRDHIWGVAFNDLFLITRVSWMGQNLSLEMVTQSPQPQDCPLSAFLPQAQHTFCLQCQTSHKSRAHVSFYGSPALVHSLAKGTWMKLHHLCSVTLHLSWSNGKVTVERAILPLEPAHLALWHVTYHPWIHRSCRLLSSGSASSLRNQKDDRVFSPPFSLFSLLSFLSFLFFIFSLFSPFPLFSFLSFVFSLFFYFYSFVLPPPPPPPIFCVNYLHCIFRVP